jgi:tetratricopeptide (TPR) repeat protein
LIRRAIEEHGRKAAFFSNLGNALRNQGRLDEAVTAHREAIRLDPGRAEFYSNLGNALRDQDKLDEAIGAYRHAIRTKPGFAEFHSNLGNALRDQDKLDDAVTAYGEAIRIRPDRPEFHFNLGIALQYQGKFEDALAAHRQAIVLKPNFVDAYNAMATALMELGRLSESRTVLEEAIRLAPRNTKCRRTLGEVVRFAAEDPHLRAMEQLSEDSAPSRGRPPQSEDRLPARPERLQRDGGRGSTGHKPSPGRLPSRKAEILNRNRHNPRDANPSFLMQWAEAVLSLPALRASSADEGAAVSRRNRRERTPT